MKNQIKNIKELIDLCLQDNEAMRVFKKHLNLIKVVDSNFDHIEDLEVLEKLLKQGGSSYIKEYYPLHDEIIKFCGIIADNTRANHYRKEDKFDDVYAVLDYLQELNDLKNESELNSFESQSYEG
jgi:uncharacterized protein related to proFAR isomerase